ncbi:hypothetical protein ANN_06597 [Periplaneta americana]|uniref:C2H2-type domain-containing protein n=1 Tax=Periplaneta americana TaxID=6978 RepID=A0ABQ8TG06_PERAM|nr:hypothetical protein ANN_06597 [Periplaneta americana]
MPKWHDEERSGRSTIITDELVEQHTICLLMTAVSRMQEFIGDEEIVEKMEKESKDDMYQKVGPDNINNWKIGHWKRSLKRFGKIPCQHLGCEVNSINLEDAMQHYRSCPLAVKKGYSCRSCNFRCEDEPEMLGHVTTAHAKFAEGSDYSDFDSCDENEDDLDEDDIVVNKIRRNFNRSGHKYTVFGKIKVISVSPDVPEFCPAGVLLHASKSTDMSLSHLSTLKCHRPGPGSNPQPWA